MLTKERAQDRIAELCDAGMLDEGDAIGARALEPAITLDAAGLGPSGYRFRNTSGIREPLEERSPAERAQESPTFSVSAAVSR